MPGRQYGGTGGRAPLRPLLDLAPHESLLCQRTSPPYDEFIPVSRHRGCGIWPRALMKVLEAANTTHPAGPKVCVAKIDGTLTVSASVPSLRKSFTWTFAGNLIYALCQWGILSVLAKLGSPEAVGQFAFGLAICAPVFMLTNVQLRGVQATDARSEYEFSHYFTLRLAATSCGLLLVVLIAFFVGYEGVTAAVVALVGVAKAIESLGDVIAGLLQKQERLDRVAIGLILRGVLSVGVFGMVYWPSHNLVYAAAALVGAWAMVELFYDLPLALGLVGDIRHFLTRDRRAISRLLILSAPLGVVMAMVSLNTNIPRYIIAHFLGQRDLGIFAAMAYLLAAGGLVVNALGQSASARLARMFAAGEFKAFKSLVWKLVVCGVMLGVCGVPLAWLFGRPVLAVLYAPEYAEHIGTFMIMVVTLAANAVASFLGYGMTAARKFKAQVPAVGAATLTAALMSFALVPRVALTGAAFALLGSAIVLCIASGAVLWTALRAQ